MNKISRRDFLKLGVGIFETILASSLISNSAGADKTGNQLPNIVLLVCDAMTARNLSLYGYLRKTTPNLEKIAEQAFVYHNHYAGGNFTSPGTASLLTGLESLTHRDVIYSATVSDKFSKHNIFHFLGDDYFKKAYSQNFWANYLLQQFSADIDSLLPHSKFGLVPEGIVNNRNFKNDLAISSRALERTLYYGNSLILSFLADLYYKPAKNAPQSNYPLGFPNSPGQNNIFTMEDLFAGFEKEILELDSLESPFFLYFHIFPPHAPYFPHKDFAGMFDKDGYKPIVKQRQHVLSMNTPKNVVDQQRAKYDAYLANLDFEIGRLIGRLRDQGILDRTHFIITSDHGEMFERGTYGHVTPMLYEPVIKAPLMILVPGNKTRRDFSSLTSSTDIMPTILNWAKRKVPPSSEGYILPGFDGNENPDRNVIITQATESSALKPFNKASYTILKWNYKLIYYHNYIKKYQDYFEFYDLLEDPEELQDKYSNPKFAAIISDLKKELFNAIDEANKKL